MTTFEQLLIDKGYERYFLNGKTMELIKDTKRYHISSLGHIDYRYIHPDKEDIICFGLHEKGKPPTLIEPRPRIKVKKEINWGNKVRIGNINEQFDDAMNLVLMNEKPELIYQSLFNKDIIFKYNLI